jgi:23S rRNA (pseudouridine1915-N3)-methyltransferase
MPVTVVAIGKKHEAWVLEGIQRYQKRLKKPFMLEWVLLPHSSLEGDSARQEESERILSRLDSYDYIVLLDERGRQLDSLSFSSLLRAQLDRSASVVFVIGGAYGVTDAIRQKAHLVWSLSPLVFPHQLVRLVLTEQVYRAQEISQGGQYHHE